MMGNNLFSAILFKWNQKAIATQMKPSMKPKIKFSWTVHHCNMYRKLKLCKFCHVNTCCVLLCFLFLRCKCIIAKDKKWRKGREEERAIERASGRESGREWERNEIEECRRVLTSGIHGTCVLEIQYKSLPCYWNKDWIWCFFFRFCFYVVVVFVIYTHDDTLNSCTFDPFRASQKIVCHFFSQVLDMWRQIFKWNIYTK